MSKREKEENQEGVTFLKSVDVEATSWLGMCGRFSFIGPRIIRRPHREIVKASNRFFVAIVGRIRLRQRPRPIVLGRRLTDGEWIWRERLRRVRGWTNM